MPEADESLRADMTVDVAVVAAGSAGDAAAVVVAAWRQAYMSWRLGVIRAGLSLVHGVLRIGRVCIAKGIRHRANGCHSGGVALDGRCVLLIGTSLIGFDDATEVG